MYDTIASAYDLLMADVDYASYAQYIQNIFNKHMKKDPEIVLDLGSGTGNLTTALRDLGYSMIGAEPSVEMLQTALSKDSTNIQYINQKAEKLDLFGTVQAVVSLLDCINHITDKKKLEAAFKKVSLFLEQDGLFIFDVNTIYKFEHIYADNVFYNLVEDMSYVWVNSYNKKSEICDMDIAFFVKKSNDTYYRYDTKNRERAYTDDYLISTAQDAGLEFVALYDDKSFKKPRKNTERQFFVFKKPSIKVDEDDKG